MHVYEYLRTGLLLMDIADGEVDSVVEHELICGIVHEIYSQN